MWKYFRIQRKKKLIEVLKKVFRKLQEFVLFIRLKTKDLRIYLNEVVEYIKRTYGRPEKNFQVAARRARKKLSYGFTGNQHGTGGSDLEAFPEMKW
jgi:hypothetical protein